MEIQLSVHGIHNFVYWGKVKNSDFNKFEKNSNGVVHASASLREQSHLYK